MSSLTIRGERISVDGRRANLRLRLLSGVSVIIPVGPGDELWRDLLSSLASLPADYEIWIVSAEEKPADFQTFISGSDMSRSIHWVRSDVGRAQQMNAGANLATQDYFWFLHADSQVTEETLAALEESLIDSPAAIHYFDLVFSKGSPLLTRLNAWGVWVRSHFLGLPFGDQGLCMSRGTFELLHGFSVDAPYGEDHLMIWAAHRKRIALKPVRAALVTSPRAYVSNGWLSMTVQHFWRTWRQAIPQLLALLWSRMR